MIWKKKYKIDLYVNQYVTKKKEPHFHFHILFSFQPPIQAAGNPGKAEKSKSPSGKKSPKPAATKKQSPAGQTADTHIEKTAGVKTRDQITDETKYIGMIFRSKEKHLISYYSLQKVYE